MSENFYFLKVNGKVEEVEYTYDARDQTLNPTSQYTWNHIRKEQFLTVEEIAAHQFEQLSDEEKKELAETDRNDLIMLHHGYGRWIRNSYGLWHPVNPFVVAGDGGDGHPDGLSMRAIYALYDLCTTGIEHTININIAYENAMTIVQEK